MSRDVRRTGETLTPTITTRAPLTSVERHLTPVRLEDAAAHLTRAIDVLSAALTDWDRCPCAPHRDRLRRARHVVRYWRTVVQAQG